MRIRPLILLAMLPILPGCSVVQSENPLSPPGAALPDKRLEGLWSEKVGKDDFGYVFITYPSRGGEGSIMEFDKNGSGGIVTASYKFFVTRTLRHAYMNVSDGVTSDESTFPVGQRGTYSFAEYHFTWLGRMVYSMVGGEAIAKAVGEGKLKGVLKRDKNRNIDLILLSDTSKHMLDFIESSKPADVYEGTTKLTRVGGP